MDTETTLYVRQLEAILACDQSDGYLKKWAEDRLEELKYQIEFTPLPAKTLIAA
jgi:hypothetical protein